MSSHSATRFQSTSHYNYDEDAPTTVRMARKGSCDPGSLTRREREREKAARWTREEKVGAMFDRIREGGRD